MRDYSGNYLKNIRVGLIVGITTKKDRNVVIKGVVKKILTKSEFHTHGIMVELDDETIGRVKTIYSKPDKVTEENLCGDNPIPEIIETKKPIGAVPKVISIAEDEEGYSYFNLFYPYLNNATRIVLEDPYIRKEYQIKNLTFFCTILMNLNTNIDLKLITQSENIYQKEDQNRKLDDLAKTLKDSNIKFSYEFNANLHDRSITTNTGWKIVLGRGLDIFKDPGSYYSPANFDQTKRKCRATNITYIKI